MNAPDLSDVLAEVNRLRAERGMDPLDAMPKGEPVSASTCPVAVALGGDVSICSSSWGRNDDATDTHPTPVILAHFMAAFDNDAYPELVA